MTQIDYAPPLIWHRRARVRRWIVAATALLSVTALARWGGPAWRKAELLLAQRACLDYSPASASVCYDEGPAAKKLLSSGGDYTAVAGFGGKAAAAAALAPKCWRRYAPMAGGTVSGATIYLGGRQSPGGTAYLVSVQYVPPGANTFATPCRSGFPWRSTC